MPGHDPFADMAAVLRDEPLARHSQFGVGGPADWFARVSSVDALQELLRRAHNEGIRVTMLGAGSNALILDSGVRGLVIRYDDRTFHADGDVMRVGGGRMMPRTALDCARRGLGGLEFGIGVPGSCGASVYGNAGAFGTEMRDVLLECEAVTPDGAELRRVSAEQCEFSYRHSAFKTTLAGYVVVAAELRVERDDPSKVRARTDAIQARRKATQPYGVRSLGSVFKNPPGDAAGRLLEACGLKGRRRGGAQISEKHANFIVNVHAATAADVTALVETAHDTVLEQFGIDLQREIVVLS